MKRQLLSAVSATFLIGALSACSPSETREPAKLDEAPAPAEQTDKAAAETKPAK